MLNPKVIIDRQLVGTPFRGLIIQGFIGYCAYVGVPEEHWLAEMDEVPFECHKGVNFQGKGGDGIRPEGWFWFGWDYQHAGDKCSFPKDILKDLPADLAAKIQLNNANGQEWTIPEIEQDLIDVAVELMAMLNIVEMTANEFTQNAVQGASEDRNWPQSG